MPNRLAGESSPYLLQHKDNPVDWYPWGAEAFATAKKLDKPIFLSIGYAACHWCHVMEHESFEDPEVAKLMNRLFVNIKVDREERPDVDAIYMNAIQITGQGGGWPLSAFCTPDGKPYFLGTYFPPADRYGRRGFADVLEAMAAVYAEQREKVDENTAAILDGLRQIDAHFRQAPRGPGGGTIDRALVITTARVLVQRCDPRHGGLGSKPKFPSSSSHELLGRAARLPLGKPAREAFLSWARSMARGGIYDHLGGGFARYSVDERWLVPHFEKMLYDNAQLLGIYGMAHAMTGEAEYARVIDETITWLEREMLDESGGLYASQDADSEGEEGKYYVWTPAETGAVLGPADAIFFDRSYGVTARGNFEHDTTVLSRVTDPGAASDEAALAAMRDKLFAARKERVPPATDTKILAAWNGLLVSGLLTAWRSTGSPRALALAVRLGNFLADRMLYQDGDSARIFRVFKDGKTKLEGTLDDYAFVARAFFDLAEATGEAAWWRRGVRLCDTITARFHGKDGSASVFYMTPTGPDRAAEAASESALLIHRPESTADGAIPSGAAVAVECFLRLGLIADDAAALTRAETYLAGRVVQMGENVFSSAHLLCAVDEYLHAMTLVVSEGEGRAELVDAARRAYAPALHVAGSWAAASLLDGKGSASDGHAQAYVCRGQTCSAPVRDPAELGALLAREPD